MISMYAIFHFQPQHDFQMGVGCGGKQACWNNLRNGYSLISLVIQKGGVPGVLLHFLYCFSKDGCNQSSFCIWFKTHTKALACWQIDCYPSAQTRCTTETVWQNLYKYSHRLKYGINIIYSKPFTQMKWNGFLLPWSKCPSLHYSLCSSCLMEWSVKI